MSNRPTPEVVHFPAFTEFSCGDALDKPSSLDLAEVTCGICRSQHELLTDPHSETVERAVHALRAFGSDLDRTQARLLLAMWSERGSLSETQAAAVVRHFRAAR